MAAQHQRRYFIVKHGLDAFKALPHYIWRTGVGAAKPPRGFRQVQPGDRWVNFAYTTTDKQEKPLSKITGFCECIRHASYGKVPASGQSTSEGQEHAWLIEGTGYGDQLIEPVGVPPIDDLLGRKTFKQAALVPISAEEFDNIYHYTLTHQFDTSTIPLLGREPECEQEVVAIVANCYEKLGISRVHRVRTAFPDLLVQIGGPKKVHLELELYSESFLSHGHASQMADRQFGGDPVAVLCWIHNKPEVEHHVHKVYELQSLLREGGKIEW